VPPIFVLKLFVQISYHISTTRSAAQHNTYTHGVRLRVAIPPVLSERQALARATPKQPVRSRTFVVSHIVLLTGGG